VVLGLAVLGFGISQWRKERNDWGRNI
jgi:hypothetical protein